MSAPPKTVLDVGPDEARAIREAVRGADPQTLGIERALVTGADAPAMTAFLTDPLVSDAIYDLPRPIDLASITGWIETSVAAQARGEALLLLTRDPEGAIAGYSQITVWPERAAAELSGAIRADRQHTGQGAASAWRTVDWIFESLGVRLVFLTAAVDNVRSARLIEAMGFVRLGERTDIAGDGVARESLYWEMTRKAWRGPAAASA